ncbi:MAG: pilus assembly protein N-terminal domain-containing protein, partial [Planctomycetaceae bacterium]|nr:pilus assembly protein N-terminal domain-containing protein [Planctomycetaceae bacterium]
MTVASAIGQEREISSPFAAEPFPQVIAQVPQPPTPSPIQELRPESPGIKRPTPDVPPPGPFRPDAVRLPALASPYGTTPRPSPETLTKFNKYVERTLDTENTLDLVIGRPRILVFKEAPFRIQLAGEGIADYTLITENELSVVGTKAGNTVLNIWFKNEDNPDKQDVLSYLVRVFPDPQEKIRLEAIYAALEKEINRNFPDSVVHLSLVGDRLLIRGQARDVEEATQILAILGDQAPGGPETIPVQNIDVIAAPGFDGEFQPGALENFLLRTDSRVINMLRIPGVQQVMLKVTVAEVNRSAARAIGASLSYTPSDSFGLFSFAPPAGAAASATASAISGGTLVINRGDFELAINALKQINLARSLAEPELTTLNGRPANFQVGGSFPVPQVTGFTAAGLQGVQFQPFGVQLSFLPVITDKDRIRLSLQASVSARDEQTGTTVGNSNVPGLTQRTFQTTVELREGQTLAVAGLIQNNFGTNSDRVPFAGD